VIDYSPEIISAQGELLLLAEELATLVFSFWFAEACIVSQNDNSDGLELECTNFF
jgi:hypothetical protein